MDTLNATDITISGYVDIEKYRYVYFSLMLTIYVLILCSNSTILYLIWVHKSLHEPMYIFIAAVLFNGALYGTVIYPKLLIDFLSEKQVISFSACIFQYYMFYTVSGSEFLLLAAMSYDRYVSICKPLRYPTIMGQTRVILLLSFSWLLSGAFTAVQTIVTAQTKLCSFDFEGIFCNNAMYTLQCVRPKVLTIFGVFCLLNLVIFPVLFTVFTYSKIFLIAIKGCKEFRRKAFETCFPHLLVLICSTCVMAYDTIIARVDSDLPKTARLIMSLQVVLYNPLLNPFIYGLKMKEISRHLKGLFCRPKV